MRRRAILEPDAPSPIRIAVVGLGYWGPNLARVVAALPSAQLAALCDANRAALADVGARYPGVPQIQSFNEVLADRSIDAVALATPVSTHHPLASAALAAGKHVFVEKPLAESISSAQSLVECARRAGLVLMPGHTFLYSPPVVKIKELIDSGELGEVYFIATSRVNLGLHQPDVSVVWDLAPHDFSILRYWLGESPTEVAAFSRACLVPGTPDVAFINLRYGTGTIAHVELSWLAPSKLRRTAIVGSRKMVVYDDTSNEPVRIFDAGVTLPDPENFGEYRLSYRTGDIVSPKIDPSEPLALELDDFCKSIADGSEARSTAELGFEVVRMIDAVDRSLASGGAPVQISALDAPAATTTRSRETAPRLPVEPSPELPALEQALRPGVRATTGEADSIGVAVLGAGPAGLTAAWTLARRGQKGAVFEAEGTVGGIAKTVEFEGFRFDLGGHRFFTKLRQIESLWEDMLGADFLTRPRLSRIYYNGQFLAYPLRANDVLRRLGLGESMLCAFSYLWSMRRRGENAESFEDWVTIRFGKRLYDAFFRTYTEKVWGIPGSEIRAQWAAQRIKNFSLGKAVLSILGLSRDHVTTLIEEFRYPRLGPGQMWEAFQQRLENLGLPVHLEQRCSSIKHDGSRVRSIVVGSNGHTEEHAVDGVLSSIALRDLVLSMDPPPPANVLAAAGRLRYRDLCLVALMTTEAQPFEDNWIYIHDPGTRAGRIQNYGAWSEDMVKPGTTCLGVEYFCFEGDEIWRMSDKEAVELATAELAKIGLIDPALVFDGVKVLVPKAYPMYDGDYEEAVEVLRDYLEQFENLETFGRNGLHRYNNQDHSMWTAVLATLNLVEGSSHDVWSVNVEEEYLEEGEAVDAALNFDLVRSAHPPGSGGLRDQDSELLNRG